MAKKTIVLKESELQQIIKESVSKILTELDWRTYDAASKKAAEAAENAKDRYERMRREKQSLEFAKKAAELKKSQYGLDTEFFQGIRRNDEIDKLQRERGWRHDNEKGQMIDPQTNHKMNIGQRFNPTSGQLKNASRREADINSYNAGLSKYENGKWQ